MIVCHCRVVTDRDVDAALIDGAHSSGAVCRLVGAAQDCGSCVFSIKKLVQQHHDQQCPASRQADGELMSLT